MFPTDNYGQDPNHLKTEIKILYLIRRNFMNRRVVVVAASMRPLNLVHFVTDVGLKVFLERERDVAYELLHGEDLVVPHLSLVIHVQDL